jgi:hypothetical protein
VLCGDRLGEGPVERRHVDEIDLISHPALGEERVGEEHELQRGDGTLDRHLDDVQNEPPARPGVERCCQRCRTVE